MTFTPLNTKDGDKFLSKDGRIWTAKWHRVYGGKEPTLKLSSPPTYKFGEPSKITLGDFAHAFEAEGLTPIEAPHSRQRAVHQDRQGEVRK